MIMKRELIPKDKGGIAKPWAFGGESHVSAVEPIWLSPTFLSYSPFLVLSSNCHIKGSAISWGSYCWGVECGRTISPCPHPHSTSRLTLTLVGKTTTPSWHAIFPILSTTTWTLPLSHSPKLVHPHTDKPFTLGRWCVCVFPYRFGVRCMCFPYPAEDLTFLLDFQAV